jgi:hypothetical protein
MSVDIKSYSGGSTSSLVDEEFPAVTTIKYSAREYSSSGNASFEIRSARSSKNPIKRTTGEKTVRRFEGFVVEDEGEEYKVAFVQDAQLVFYYLPASQLRAAGISAPNQPFQMDEMEVKLSTGSVITGYAFVPLAKPSDSFNDSIDLNKNERRDKLNAVFKRFGKTSD